MYNGKLLMRYNVTISVHNSSDFHGEEEGPGRILKIQSSISLLLGERRSQDSPVQGMGKYQKTSYEFQTG